MRFPAEQRLRRQRDFRDVREKGRRLDCGAFTFWYHRRADAEAVEPLADGFEVFPGPRVGVVASIAAVGAAVRRNRAKRRLREVFRRHQSLVPPGYDLLLVARRTVNRVEYRRLEQMFVDACRKLFPPAP